MQLWDLNDILQGSENTVKGQVAMSDSDSDEMDVDDNPSQSKKGMLVLFSALDLRLLPKLVNYMSLSSITNHPVIMLHHYETSNEAFLLINFHFIRFFLLRGMI